MLKLRLIRINDYAVLEGGQRIGPNPLRQYRASGCGLPMGSARDLDTAKAEFKAAWKL